MRLSLRARVAMASAGGVTMVVAVTGAALLWQVSARERDELDSTLERRADLLAPVAAAAAAAGRQGGLDTVTLPASPVVGRVLRGDEVLLTIGAPPDPPLPVPPGPGFATVAAGHGEWRTYTRTLDGALRLQVATPTTGFEQSLVFLRRRIVRSGLLGVAGAAVLGWVLGAVVLRPLARLRAAAERVAATHDLVVRVPAGTGPAEVESLATALNMMLERLGAAARATETALDASRGFASAAGHELRTPLTSISANLDVLRDNPDLPPTEHRLILSAVIEQRDRLVAVLDALQALARGEAARVRDWEPVDLGELVHAAAEDLRRRHPKAAVKVNEPGDRIDVPGWPEGLRLLVGNLLENAAVHGGAGRATVRVELTLERVMEGWRLVVDDDGPGISEADRAVVLERFVRGRHARAPGSGLGLALVSQQAALHDGTVSIGSSPLGGARLTVELPSTAAPTT